MERVTISKRVLDRLIRAKLEMIDDCTGVSAMPVIVRKPANVGSQTGCNWTVPGWTGEADFVNRCNRRMKSYLEFLRGQFNVND